MIIYEDSDCWYGECKHCSHEAELPKWDSIVTDNL